MQPYLEATTHHGEDGSSGGSWKRSELLEADEGLGTHRDTQIEELGPGTEDLDSANPRCMACDGSGAGPDGLRHCCDSCPYPTINIFAAGDERGGPANWAGEARRALT